MSVASPPGNAPKAMSSRLLTMKFMQRAANSSPTHPAPSTPEEPSPKRQKRSRDSSPLTNKANSLGDRAAVAAALASEETKRQAALERQAAEADDTRWVLSFENPNNSTVAPPLTLRIIEAGFAHLDASPSQQRYQEEEPEDKPVLVGRRSFGKFNRLLEKQQSSTSDLSSDSEFDKDEDDEPSEDSEDDSDDPTQQLIASARKEAGDRARAERKAMKRKAQEELGDAAKKRRKSQINLNDEVSLNQLTSLSGKPDPPRKVPPGTTCFNCGGPHFKRDCPNQKRGHKGGDDGRSRKARKAK